MGDAGGTICHGRFDRYCRLNQLNYNKKPSRSSALSCNMRAKVMEYVAKEKEYKDKIISSYKPILESLEVSQEDRERVSELKKECKQAVLQRYSHYDFQLQEKCQKAIQKAFSHYLYRVTHSKGGRLTYCWINATCVDTGFRHRHNEYGAHDPSSPEELYAMMSQTISNPVVEKSIKDNYLRQAHNASNALILKSDELTKIYREFLCSLNLSSIYNSLVTRQ